MSKLLKKLTPKTIMGPIKVLYTDLLIANRDDSKVKTMPCFRIMGIARGVETGESDLGPWVRFKGNFKAINVQTGEEFRGGKAHIPGAAGSLLEGAVLDGEAVEFAFDIGIELDASSAVGYNYTSQSLIEPNENDPVNSLAKSLPALPGAETKVLENKAPANTKAETKAETKTKQKQKQTATA